MAEIEIKTEYVTLDEIAARYGFGKDKTRKLIYDGKIPAVQFGREWRITERMVLKSQEKDN